eukprot:1180707-Prorocentrum_minimum.AAC.3
MLTSMQPNGGYRKATAAAKEPSRFRLGGASARPRLASTAQSQTSVRTPERPKAHAGGIERLRPWNERCNLDYLPRIRCSRHWSREIPAPGSGAPSTRFERMAPRSSQALAK